MVAEAVAVRLDAADSVDRHSARRLGSDDSHFSDPAVSDSGARGRRQATLRRMAATVARESGTTYATLGGFALSIAFGIPMALMIAYSRTVESFVYPLLVFSQSVPKIAIAPLFVVWFGFGNHPKVICAFMLGFFPIVVSTVVGFKSVDPDMLDLARSMKASRLATFVRISLPQALPSIFAGLKVSSHWPLSAPWSVNSSDRTRASAICCKSPTGLRLAADVRRADRSVCDRRPSLCRGRHGRAIDDPVARIAT